ncbi:MAG: HEAT repeat domain-containing protein [Deltaproteobacteria bacterium]|nr:HEAT repeat domain-containing protein [Deltaproteobacteria bacterium]
MQRRRAVRILVALFVLLGTTATFSYGLSLEDQILKRSGPPVYLKDGTTCECERFWWLILAADFIQCDKGTWAEEIPVAEVDLERTFGKGTLERVERLRAGRDPAAPKTVTLESTTAREEAGKDGSVQSPERSPSRSGDVDFQAIGERLDSGDAEVLGKALLELQDYARDPASRTLIPRLTALLGEERRVSYTVTRTGLASSFRDGEAGLSELAASCLQQMGQPAAEALHLGLGRSPSPKVRRRIYGSLSRMQEKSSWPWMVRGLRQEADSGIRLAAIGYFQGMKDARALPHLEEAFGGKVRLRCAVIEAMGAIGDPGAIPFLQRILREEENHAVRNRAAGALGDIGDPGATRALIRASKEERNRTEGRRTVQNAVENALEKTADSGSLQDLIHALSDRNVSTRISAARALARLRNPDSASSLARALTTDADGEVRTWAAQGLYKLQGREARSALIHALLHESEVDLRRIVALGLRNQLHPEVVDALARAVRQDPDRKVRMNAMSSILHMGELGKRGMGALEYAAENDAVAYNREKAAYFLESLQAY